MSVFNAERHLNEAIESILNQTFKDFEFLIINDCPTDLSKKIILSYGDSRIYLIKIDGEGNNIWGKKIGPKMMDSHMKNLRPTNDGNIIAHFKSHCSFNKITEFSYIPGP